MPTRENPYYDPTYAQAGASLAEALFGNADKQVDYDYKRANTKLIQERTRRLQKMTDAGIFSEGGGSPLRPVPINPKTYTAIDDMVKSVLSEQLGEDFSLDVIPQDALLNARGAGEQAFQQSRNRTDAVNAMINALGLPPGARVGEDPERANDWIPFNDKSVVLNSQGIPVDFQFGGASQPVDALLNALPAKQRQIADDVPGFPNLMDTAPASGGPANDRLIQEAEAAIAAGADPRAVQARLRKLQGGSP